MPLIDTDRELTQDSYYLRTAPAWQPSPALAGEVDCDVAVVGAGLAGLSAALELASRGLKVTVLEAQQVGFGASGRNGGQAIHGLACDMSVIEAQLGRDEARRVFEMSIEALDLIRQRIARHGIAFAYPTQTTFTAAPDGSMVLPYYEPPVGRRPTK